MTSENRPLGSNLLEEGSNMEWDVTGRHCRCWMYRSGSSMVTLNGVVTAMHTPYKSYMTILDIGVSRPILCYLAVAYGGER